MCDMKRAFFVFIVITLTTCQTVSADPISSLTDDQLSQIKQNCSRVKTTLARIHANDGLLRVNQGQQYETITTKLMAPLNSRIALNQLDGVDMVKTTVDYNTQLSKFRDEYRLYEEKLSNLLHIDCSNEPYNFYESIKPTRKQRARVAASVTKLNQLIDQYKSQLDTFYSKTFPTHKESPSNEQ